ncbi:hypothetical protein J4573_33310 [Actinomadura barringtoniae]|uniref:Uncharacterized protein n=1 Tax=Actinomadura barringtoniae TaxID=1427535 RepID=A0A939PG32_9ACTN|nr:hypothetical protein [Actinomadura barringtoniae]MBO2452006.1 hypothetical protein [Actinomadura barringtoniae]
MAGAAATAPATDTTTAARLRTLARERSTGVLQIGTDGAFELVNGIVTVAASPHAPGPERLVAGPTGLETLALISVFDAAYFLLDAAAEPEFIDGLRLHSGPHCNLAVATLVHEYERRRALLEARWPHPQLCRAPVVPVRRVRRQRVILTGLEAEILINADGRRTPVELAHHLGRSAFACLLAVHELAAASLVEADAGALDPPAAPGPSDDGHGRSAEPGRPALPGMLAGGGATETGPATGLGTAAVPGLVAGAGGSGPFAGTGAIATPGANAGTGGAGGGPALPRRSSARGAAAEPAAGAATVPAWEPPDLDLLKRLHAALEEMS